MDLKIKKIEKNYVFFNYLIFFIFGLFFLNTLLTNKKISQDIKSNSANKANPSIVKIKKFKEDKKTDPIALNDFLELNVKIKQNEIKKEFSQKKAKINANIKPLKYSKKKDKFNYSLLKNQKKNKRKKPQNIIKIKKLKVINNDITVKKNNYFKLQSKGELLLKKNNFNISFSWPIDKQAHNLIYKILTKCLNVKTVILGVDGIIYSQEGIISRDLISNKFSPILRMPNFSSVLEENKIFDLIQSKNFNSKGGKLLRVFNRKVDAYILGMLNQMAISNKLPFKKISGVYFINNNKQLILKDIIIDNVYFDRIVNLSNINNKC